MGAPGSPLLAEAHTTALQGNACFWGKEDLGLLQIIGATVERWESFSPAPGVARCVDCRKLNAMTWKDGYPLPRMDNLLERMSGGRLNHDGFLYPLQLVPVPGDAFWVVQCPLNI